MTASRESSLCAGIWDACGALSLANPGKFFAVSARLRWVSAREDVVYLFSKEVGVGRVRNPLLTWRATSMKDVLHLAEMLWPWAGETSRKVFVDLLWINPLSEIPPLTDHMWAAGVYLAIGETKCVNGCGVRGAGGGSSRGIRICLKRASEDVALRFSRLFGLGLEPDGNNNWISSSLEGAERMVSGIGERADRVGEIEQSIQKERERLERTRKESPSITCDKCGGSSYVVSRFRKERSRTAYGCPRCGSVTVLEGSTPVALVS